MAKKISTVVLMLLFAISLFSGCDPKPVSKLSVTQSPEATQAPTATPSPSNQPPIVHIPQIGDGYVPNISGTIVWTYNTNNSYTKKAASDFINAFKDVYPNANVKLDSSAASPERIASGTIGDVFYLGDTEIYKYAVMNNGLMPLECYVAALQMDLSDVYPELYNMGKIEDHLYYVSKGYDRFCFSYNKSKLIDLNLDALVSNDWSWDSFRDIAKTITYVTNNSEKAFYGAKIDLTYSPIYVTFFESAVGSDWCNTEERKIKFTDFNGETLKAFTECMDDAVAGFINPGVSSVAKGEPIFKYCVYNDVLNRSGEYDNADLQWDLVAFPGFGENGRRRVYGCGSTGFGVYNRTQNTDTAAAFALFFYTEDGQQAYNGSSGVSIPVMESLRESTSWRFPDDEILSTKNWDAFVYEAQSASVIGQVVCRMPYEVAQIIDSEMTSIVSNCMRGKAAIYDEFTRLETKCNEMWSVLSGFSK